MTYAGLGSRWKDAAKDTTGDNPGNWTTMFSAADIGVKVPWFELYRAVAESVQPGTIAKVLIGTQPISAVQLSEVGEWDPAQVPLLQPGQELRIYWNVPATSAVPPRITIWLRYDYDEWGAV